MKSVESTRVAYDDIVQCVESDDGEYRVAVYDKPGSPAHEQALERVRKMVVTGYIFTLWTGSRRRLRSVWLVLRTSFLPRSAERRRLTNEGRD